MISVRHRSLALAAVAALALAACSAPDSDSDADPTPSVVIPTTVPDSAAEIYLQPVDWSTCGDLECATLQVPLDWSDPGGDTIDLAINRHAATGDRIGSLLVNPGGPGGSGIEAMPSLATSFGDEVVERYDLIGFDPRGVGESTAISCVDDAEMDVLVAADYDYSTDEGVAEAEAAATQLGQDCLDRTGPLLEHVDTVSAAKDMDVIRAVLGDDTLTYVGYSYGTQLGATYAALFPQQVGRLVLDGAVDPTLSSQELSIGQAVGFENALRAYVTDCQTTANCPLTGTVDEGMAQIRALFDQATASPLPTQESGRVLTGALAFSGVALPLYDESSWSYLTQGLRGALQGDGSVLLQLADIYYDRQNGKYVTNSTVAFWGIGCADDRGTTDIAQMRADAAEIEAAAPTVGSYFGYGGILCGNWPVPEAGGLDTYTAEGAAPIVVIGTTNDPATPYSWSESLTQALGDSATLLTYEGEGHTAYGRSNSCILDTVDAYLVDGTVPAEGTRC